jgi:hypothetical protein
MVAKYQKRISSPILDRIDIHLEVQRVLIASWPRSAAATWRARNPSAPWTWPGRCSTGRDNSLD